MPGVDATFSAGAFPRSQGPAVDLGGYWMPDPAKAAKAMRPSETLNKILGV